MVLDAISLSEETFIAIFGHLTNPQLSVASTVCKTWSKYALALLYRRIMLLQHTNDLNHIALLKCHNLDEDFLSELTRKHSKTLEKFTLWGPRTFESGPTPLNDKLLNHVYQIY
ncbi:unnamed protein product [Rhizophagus irregularis]|nr:unnamed protein product [Rhizophagus irregularis]